ncbi:pilus assembly protein TadG-related protein [Vibrio natriegens]|uniref:pilus assembly protein TadG-related protein n=1 Tax=Vibrio natriegens TaxID=691 RepID=UPI003B5BA6A1
MSFRSSMTTRRSQQGITLVLFSLIILILIGMGAFAIDLNHQVLNKARLQNAVDSAALAAAVVADDTDDFGLAEKAAIDALKSFVADSSGNEELAAEVEGIAGEISITFSNTKEKDSFYEAGDAALDSEEDIYVRVAVSGLSLTQFLSRIFRDGKYVSASAVAGPSATIEGTCNVSPVGMCATNDSSDLAWGYIPSNADPNAPDYDAKTDRNADTVHVLKPPGHTEGGIGAGNYHLLDFGSGASTVRELFAGYSKTCVAVGDDVTTQPGKEAGPVTKGLNTRFDGDDPIEIKEGNEVVETIPIKPDKYLEESNVTYENYKTEYEDAETNLESDTAFYYADYYESLQSCVGEGMEGGRACKPEYYDSSGEEGRRVLRVPILDCSSTTKDGGAMDIKVLGIGCFFVTQRVEQSNSIIFGQFLDNCTVQNASTGIEPSTDNIGPYKIQLYKDPESGES